MREQFPYHNPPKVLFDGLDVPLAPPEEILITDTTFRDGQQARAPLGVAQIVRLYDLLHRLSGPNGVIRKSEFFLYSARDREAVREVLARGYRYPEVTGWVRAKREDLRLVREAGLKETGILTSCSDYHIFLKLGWDRRKAFDISVGVVSEALAQGLRVRCHLEDLTRADVTGFVVPLALRLMALAEVADYMERECQYPIPASQPFVGRAFNATAAGIHADGVMKNEEIYNIFDTAALRNRLLAVNVTDRSGAAGVAFWIRQHAGQNLSKDHPVVEAIHAWIMQQYSAGRPTAISDAEMAEQVKRHLQKVTLS